MTFSTLAKYYEKLEATSKRLELIDILSQLFKESNAEEIGKICYLLQGRVAPFFEPIEIGMAEAMIAQAVARAFETDKNSVLKLYREKGNFGLAAQSLSNKQKAKSKKELSVTEVSDELLRIAKFSGEGTVEKKVGTLSELLKKLDPISVKHVVNIPLGTLRLGIGGPTVLDSLSLAKHGDKTLRPILEDAYNKTSDLGLVAQTFFKSGIDAVKKTKLIVGKPVRPALAERLPSAEEAVKRLGHEFAAEPKFDGFRVQIHLDHSKKGTYQSTEAQEAEELSLFEEGKKGKPEKLPQSVMIFSRNLENMTHAFPDLIEGVLKEVKAKSAILEGEAIAYNPVTSEFLPFQETTKRRRKYNVEEKAKELPLVMFTFDILYLNGEDVTEKPYRERRKLLEKILSKDESDLPAGRQVVRLAEERVLKNPTEIHKFFDEEISEGLEGLMLKKLDSPYVAGGRGFHWVKFKRSQAGALADTVDCVLLGVYTGKGKRTEFGVGGLLVGVYDDKKDEFVSITRLGTGLTDDEFRRVNEIYKKLKVEHKPARVNSDITPSFWLEPKVVLEIASDEITRSPIHTAGRDKEGSGYALRFPRLVKFRETDKRAEDATTVSEIEKMYKQQFVRK